MGLGILEDRVMEHVPGTTRYFDDPERPQVANGSVSGLKTDNNGPVPIILVPQPSDDPNDPLNWPLWKRDCIILALSLISVFSTALGSILAANTLTLSIWYTTTAQPRTFTDVAILTGYYLLGVGFAGIFFVPTARVFGKRHLYLLGTILCCAASGWAGGSGRCYKSMLWARIVQGVGTAPFEALVNASVGDLYFVHERGKRMALTNLAVFGGAFFTPIVVGKITHTIGWEWSFYFEAIFCGICIPIVFCFVPETAYRRAGYLNTDLNASDNTSLGRYSAAPAGLKTEGGFQISDLSQQRNSSGSSDHKANAAHFQVYGNPGASTPKRTWVQSLSPFNGFVSDENFFKLLFRPFPLFFHPAILWACFIQGCMIGWTVFVGIILAAIFLGPPLFWDEVDTGYAYTGAFIGAIAGFLIAGSLADWSAKYLTKLNNGVYEPEFRILLVIPQLVFGVAGLYGFGVTAAEIINYSWVLPVFFFGLIVAGMVIGAVASSLYIIDAHRDIAIEAFTCQLIFKNFFTFGLTFSAYEWLVHGGTYKTFMWIASITVVICLTSIPMYVFGKRNRSYFHRHDILTFTKLR